MTCVCLKTILMIIPCESSTAVLPLACEKLAQGVLYCQCSDVPAVLLLNNSKPKQQGPHKAAEVLMMKCYMATKL